MQVQVWQREGKSPLKFHTQVFNCMFEVINVCAQFDSMLVESEYSYLRNRSGFINEFAIWATYLEIELEC